MKRNLKFWTRYTFETMGADFLIAGVLAVLTVLGANRVDWKMLASVVPYFLCIGSILGLMMVTMGSVTLYVPLLVSMGETRRNVFWGFCYYRALVTGATVAVCGLIWLLLPGEVSASGLRSIPVILCALVLASSLGGIMGTLFVKWKWAATIAIFILCGGIGGCMGAFGVETLNGELLGNTLALAAHLEVLPWWLLAAAAAALAADLIFQWLLLRRREVKL